MKGNNLFDGLGSGTAGKYKKAGDEAARRERAEKLDAQIEQINSRKRNYAWAEEALAFVEEQTRLNSDVFDISVNASLLNQIKAEAQYIVDKQKAEDEARRKKEEAEKAAAEKRKQEEAAERKKAEEERRRIEAEKKLEAERLEKERREKEAQLAKEKEERWENDTAESTDKLIINLSLAPKSLFWCEDVKNAQNLVKSLSVKVRAKCKNLELLSELALTSRKVADAATADEFILQLEADCARDERNYAQVKEIEKMITDSCRPYMKEYEKYKSLREAAAEYDKQQRLKAEEKARAEKEKAARIAKEAAELDALRKKAATFDTKIDDLDKRAKKAKEKKTVANTAALELVYAEAGELLKSIPEKASSLIKKYKVLVNLDNEGKAYFDKKAEDEKAAAIKEKAEIEAEKKRAAEIDALLIEIDAAKRIRQTFDEIAKLEKEVTPRMRTFIKDRKLFDKLTAEADAYFEKIKKEEKAEAERQVRLEQERRDREARKQREKLARKSRLAYEIPIIATIILVAGAFIGASLAASLKPVLFYSVLGICLVCSFIPYFTKFRRIAAPAVYVYQTLVLAGLVVATHFLFPAFFAAALAFAISVFALIMGRAIRNIWVNLFFSLLQVIAFIVAVYFILDAFNLSFAGIILAAGAGLAYGILTRRTYVYTRLAKAAEVVLLYILNGFVAVAAIVFTAIGGTSAFEGTIGLESCLGVGFGVGALSSYILTCRFFKHKYDNQGVEICMLLCGITATITGIAVAVALRTLGDGIMPFTLIAGLTMIVAFIPFYVFVYIRIFYDDDAYNMEFEALFMVFMAIAPLVMSMVSACNFTGEMVLTNAGMLFNGLVCIVTVWIIFAQGAGYFDSDFSGWIVLLNIVASILFCVSCPVTIVQSIARVDEMLVRPEAIPEAAAFVKKILSAIIR